MEILWITNIVFPEAERLLTGSGDMKASGGWMLGAADALLESRKDISLTLATVTPKVKDLTKLKGERITYYLIPYGKGNLKRNPEYEPYWKEVRQEVHPDVVHIYGTEYSHGLAYINACGSANVVLSIQGLKSACAFYYNYGMTSSDVIRNITFRDFIGKGILGEKKRFTDAGVFEKELITKAHYIVGRTSWDRAKIWSINPRAMYFYCNETLRKEFYSGEIWKYENCKKHSIFISQAHYPLKGLHQLLKAMPLILRYFPDTKIRIAGNDLSHKKGIKRLLFFSGYMRYINSLIKQNNLKGNISFVGDLSAEGMKEEYLNANVFVCPSSIENSPNSLGEAQILGVPCVASYVGGIPDMMQGSEDYLYRFEEYEMLAYLICNIFYNADNVSTEKMRISAARRHNPQANLDTILDIYRSVMKHTMR